MSIKKILKNKRKQIVLVGLFLVIVSTHSLISYLYSQPGIQNNSLNVILEYLRSLYQSPGFDFYNHQINFYTGNPFFLFPFILLLGMSPEILRLLLILTVATSSGLAFLIYYNAYNLRRAVIGILILFNMNTWLLFRDADYTYGILFPTLILYLFSRWHEFDETISFYLFSFFTGFLLYFKFIVGYMTASLIASKVILDGKSLMTKIGIRKIIIATLFFLVGLLPLIKYGIERQFEFVYYSLGIQEYGRGSHSLTEIFLERIIDLSHVLRPSNFHNLGGACRNISCLDINIFFILLMLGIIVSLGRRRKALYTLTFLGVFSLLLYVPNVSRWMQLTVLIPMTPLIMLSLLDEIPKYRKQSEKILALILFLGLIFSLTGFEEASDNRFSENPKHWGGTQEFYEDFSKINTTNELATNNYYLWTTSRYDFDINSVLLMPEKSRQLDPELWSMWNNLLSKGHMTLEKHEATNKTTFIIDKDLDCYRGDACGYNKTQIINEYNLVNYTSYEATIVEERFTVMKP